VGVGSAVGVTVGLGVSDGSGDGVTVAVGSNVGVGSADRHAPRVTPIIHRASNVTQCRLIHRRHPRLLLDISFGFTGHLDRFCCYFPDRLRRYLLLTQISIS